MTWFNVNILSHATYSYVDNFNTSQSIKLIILIKTSFPRPIWRLRTGTTKFFTGNLTHIDIELTPLPCENPLWKIQMIVLYKNFRLERVQLFPIGLPQFICLAGANMQSEHQGGDIPYFPRTMTQKTRSLVTKKDGLKALHIVSPLGCGRVKLWVRILNCILP